MKRLAILAAAAVLICFPTLALANSVSYTTSTPIANTTLTDWSSTLAFEKFNSSLGTLYQVELYLSSGMNTVIKVENVGDSASSGSAKTEVQLNVQDAGLKITDIPQIDKMIPSAGYSFTDLQPGHYVTSSQYNSSGLSDSFYDDAGLLTEFIGSGNILLNASSKTLTWITYGGGNTVASQVTHAGLTGTITYYYNAVPIPPTALLLGSGLVGLLAWGRRKKKTTA